MNFVIRPNGKGEYTVILWEPFPSDILQQNFMYYDNLTREEVAQLMS